MMMGITGRDIDPIARLQEWFASQCNEDWEHTYGFKLETLDNPGWTFEADFAETEWEGLVIARKRTNRSEMDWLQHEVQDDKYIACGGPFNLAEMIQVFFDVLESEKPIR